MMAAGPITAIPLLLFAAGARRIRLSTLGLLQFIAPTLQLLLGIWMFHEPFGGARMWGFVIIWAALALYSAEGLLRSWWIEPPAVATYSNETGVQNPRPFAVADGGTARRRGS
jgi:chloramphenicol-sensitive protein RarD